MENRIIFAGPSPTRKDRLAELGILIKVPSTLPKHPAGEFLSRSHLEPRPVQFLKNVARTTNQSILVSSRTGPSRAEMSRSRFESRAAQPGRMGPRPRSGTRHATSRTFGSTENPEIRAACARCDAAHQAQGCANPYYYPYPGQAWYGYPGGACAPTTVIPTAPVTTYGQVCDVPTTVSGGTVVSSGRGLTPTPILGGARPPSVVQSQPRNGSLFGWRPADMDDVKGTTVISGAVDDSTVTR